MYIIIYKNYYTIFSAKSNQLLQKYINKNFIIFHISMNICVSLNIRVNLYFYYIFMIIATEKKFK